MVYDHEHALSILYDMLTEAGVEVLANHLPCHVEMAGDEIVHVDVATTRGVDRFSAGAYVDCTGNGDIAAAAGVPSQMGDDDGRMMGATLTFFMVGVDWDRAFPQGHDPYFTEYAQRGIAAGRLPRTMPQIYLLKGFRDGTVFFNMVTVTGVDGTDPRSVASGTRVARRYVMRLARFCREEMPGFERSHVADIGPSIGVRETRRLEGLYRLTRADIAAATSSKMAWWPATAPWMRCSETTARASTPTRRRCPQGSTTRSPSAPSCRAGSRICCSPGGHGRST